MGRRSHLYRRHAADALGDSIEFADLLDAIRSETVTAVDATVAAPSIEPVVAEAAVDLEPVVDLEPAVVEAAVEPLVEPFVEPIAEPPTAAPPAEPVPNVQPDPVVEPILVSRFADADMDDDRLPLQTKGRKQHH